MRIVNMDVVDRDLTGFGSTGVTHTPLYRRDDAEVGSARNAKGVESADNAHPSVNLMRLAAGGRIAVHPAALPQLLAVVSGAGWVRGGEDVWTPITAGRAAFWESGEQHETWTDTGMTVVIVEAAGRSHAGSLFGAVADAPPGGRSAARVVCVNDQREVLLLRWRAPSDGALCWEPPGGGIEPGELPVDAARREWAEETGLPGEMVGERHVFVHRDLWWDGVRFIADEAFFLARCSGAPEVSTRGMTAQEIDDFAGYRWVPIRELDTLAAQVEPAGLAGVVRELLA